jgi:hypothetical protein
VFIYIHVKFTSKIQAGILLRCRFHIEKYEPTWVVCFASFRQRGRPDKEDSLRKMKALQQPDKDNGLTKITALQYEGHTR